MSHRSILASLVVWAIALALYLGTLAPTITWAHHGADGGDVITASVTSGVAHPPGYPAYVTLGHLFAQAPIGNAAYRLNVMSAVCMALAAAMITVGLMRTLSPRLSPVKIFSSTEDSSGVRAGVGILGGLVFAAAPMVWGQATIAEVHALNALFVAAILCLLAPAVFRNESILFYQLIIVIFLWGLSLGNLLTIAALAPMMLVTWRRAARYVPRTTPSLFTLHSSLFSAFLLGLGIYLLIPLRAATQPPINWGNAITFDRLIAQVSAELYRGYAFGLPLSEYPSRLIAFAQLLVAQFGWIGVLLGAVGIRQALSRPASPERTLRATLNPLAVTVALYAVFALGYNTADSDLYLIPVWLFGAWAIAYGSLAVVQWAARRRFGLRPSTCILVAIMLVPGLTVVTNYASMNLHADRTAEDFAQAILTHAPVDAILITRSDAHTFTLWYYRLVESRRPDIAIVDARLAGYAWYDQMLIAQGRAPHLPGLDPEATWLKRLAAANPTRPACEIDAVTAKMDCQ